LWGLILWRFILSSYIYFQSTFFNNITYNGKQLEKFVKGNWKTPYYIHEHYKYICKMVPNLRPFFVTNLLQFCGYHCIFNLQPISMSFYCHLTTIINCKQVSLCFYFTWEKLVYCKPLILFSKCPPHLRALPYNKNPFKPYHSLFILNLQFKIYYY
jgi:hypothetical protein